MPCRLDNNLFLALHIDCIVRHHVHVNRSLIHIANTCHLVVASPAMTYQKPLELANLVHIRLWKLPCNLDWSTKTVVVPSHEPSAPPFWCYEASYLEPVGYSQGFCPNKSSTNTKSIFSSLIYIATHLDFNIWPLYLPSRQSNALLPRCISDSCLILPPCSNIFFIDAKFCG